MITTLIITLIGAWTLLLSYLLLLQSKDINWILAQQEQIKKFLSEHNRRLDEHKQKLDELDLDTDRYLEQSNQAKQSFSEFMKAIQNVRH